MTIALDEFRQLPNMMKKASEVLTCYDTSQRLTDQDFKFLCNLHAATCELLSACDTAIYEEVER